MTNSNYSLSIEKVLSATPEMVFDAWLDQENIGKWLAPAEGVTLHNPSIDATVGGKFNLTMKMGDKLLPHVGEYKKINRATELQFTWSSAMGTNDITTLVTLTFEAVGSGKTKLSLVHELLPSEAQRDNHNGGWTRILDGLAAFAEK